MDKKCVGIKDKIKKIKICKQLKFGVFKGFKMAITYLRQKFL